MKWILRFDVFRLRQAHILINPLNICRGFPMATRRSNHVKIPRPPHSTFISKPQNSDPYPVAKFSHSQIGYVYPHDKSSSPANEHWKPSNTDASTMTTLKSSQTTRAAKKNQLYEACAQQPEHVFSTAELNRLGICEGANEVAVLCTELLQQNLFRMYRGEGEEVHFQVATKEQAKMFVDPSYSYTLKAA